MTGPASEVTFEEGAQERLSATDIETLRQAFAADGFAVIRSVAPKPFLEDIRARLLAAFEASKQSGALFNGGGNISGHLNCGPGEAARPVFDLLRQRGVLDAIETIWPRAIRLPNVGCNFNLPHSKVQHWHVDSNYFVEDFLVCNVALVDTDLQNGAIDVIPASQQRYYPYWRFALERPDRAHKRLPLRQGDLLLRSSNTWHRGMPNFTETARPMLAFTWEDGGAVQDDPFQVDEGKIVFRPNWYRPDFVGRLRERVFVAAPVTYHVSRIVKSVVGHKNYAR